MTAERVNPPQLSPPTGFSHAVVATGTRVVFLAGQTALDTDGQVTGETSSPSPAPPEPSNSRCRSPRCPTGWSGFR